jgi:phosphoglycolate phosphatase-like HAD superfamily hydrolase
MNRVAVFDLDGTIIDVRYRYFRIFTLFLEIKSLPNLSFEEYIQLRNEGQKDVSILEKYTNSSHLIDEFNSFKIEHIEKIEYLKFDHVRPGVLRLLNELSDNNFNLELLTLRKNLVNLLWQLDNLSILSLFSKITHDFGKLSKSVYLKSLKSKSNKVIFIGDSDLDYLAANESGTHFYLVNDNYFFTNKNLVRVKRFSFEELLTEIIGD